ncbi:hypothetical protein SAMN04488056_103345 [Cohaesibacter marisflavi]|uniref:Uncharacterized protein n=1 Tax=Cohaesibacter marisflavi TaxID=655353 RepID=A0A1I5ETP1_9HYPH|nr:hypothetical protein SAMN04488056_103345 [Cohaesibacter marisflavi]
MERQRSPYMNSTCEFYESSLEIFVHLAPGRERTVRPWLPVFSAESFSVQKKGLPPISILRTLV